MFAQAGVVPGAFPRLWEQMWDGRQRLLQLQWLLPAPASSLSERVDFNVSTGQFTGLKQRLHFPRGVPTSRLLKTLWFLQ